MHNVDLSVNNITQRLEKLKRAFDLEQKEKDFRGLEEKSTNPDLWSDQEKARNLMKDLNELKEEIEYIKKLQSDAETLAGFAKEGQLPRELLPDLIALDKGLSQFEIKSFLSEKYDKKNCLISIHAGQGGVEAMDWVGMLFRMYIRYSEQQGFKSLTVDTSPGEEAGYKSITFKLEGPFAYGYLKNEAGTHRLVRQSPFNADSLRQTSFALVEVLPELEKEDLPNLEVKDSDLEWQFFRASSQGGQNVQKVSTAVRLKHIPTDIVVTAQTERFQEQNRKIALNLLRAKLWLRQKAETDKKVKSLKGEYRPASWGNQIRSYVLHPYKLVKDLRTGASSQDAQKVLDGDIGLFVEAGLTK